MLIGYVSDEHYLALPGVSVDLARNGETVAVTKSTARGAIVIDIEPGEYRVTLAKAGFSAKWCDVSIGEGRSHQFRLMSDCLIGYAWPGAVRSGELAELKVHSTEPYKAELWRYGAEKQFVRLLGWFDEHGPRAMTQLLPDGDFTIEGTKWNGGGFATSPAFVYRVSAPQRSGLYYVHLLTAAGGFFGFPLIVAPERPRARVAVVAGTNTWNSYNRFGGRSNYVNAEGLPPVPIVYARDDLVRYTRGTSASQGAPNDLYPPLSFDRPNPDCHVPLATDITDPIDGRVACTLAPATWRLLGWLERAGIDYDLYSDHQLHSGSLDLDAYSLLVLDPHPEYWSATAYHRVYDWVYQRGGHLAYLGGNGIDCEIEFVDDLAARHLTQSVNPAKPEDAGLESRFHRTVESQARLLGVVFNHLSEGTAAPYEVVTPDHWVFAGTELKAGARFGERSLHERVPGGASGHETDTRTPSTPNGVELLAKGLNPNGGGAEMVYYETPSGGAVFSVGSITYISSLLVDDNLSTITENALRGLAGDGLPAKDECKTVGDYLNER